MIADLKPYAEYKESGLPWLGQVPGHWDVRQPRQVGRLLKGVGGTKEDALSAGVPCVRYGDLYTTHTYFVRAPKTFIHPDRATDYTLLHYGDVLFAASGETLEDIGKSAVNLIEGTAVCGGDVIILRPTVPVHAPFLGYVMDCRPSANQKATMGRGTTVKHIYPDEIKHLLFPLPPVSEQAAIVRSLDWANGRLERAIRGEAEGDRAAQRAEAGHHPPCRHPRPRPRGPFQTLRHPLARRHSAALGGAAAQVCSEPDCRLPSCDSTLGQ